MRSCLCSWSRGCPVKFQSLRLPWSWDNKALSVKRGIYSESIRTVSHVHSYKKMVRNKAPLSHTHAFFRLSSVNRKWSYPAAEMNLNLMPCTTPSSY
ncbi:hypothetical protein ABKN59_009194 [Abortiporus biennis]